MYAFISYITIGSLLLYNINILLYYCTFLYICILKPMNQLFDINQWFGISKRNNLYQIKTTNKN
jgi:hypothetical protein